MAHSVEQHLSVSPAGYDVEIRRFIPAYDSMLDEAAEAVAAFAGAAPRVVDLGAGTGALTERVARRVPAARFTLVDVDPAMLARAAERLAGARDRVALREQSFDDPIPPCDAAIAALALHHVRDPDAKRALYKRIHDALAPGGALVIADGMVAERGRFAEDVRRGWAEHLVRGGDDERAAWARFDEWAKEDRYFPVAEELARLRVAGFAEVDVRWRVGPLAVVVALR